MQKKITLILLFLISSCSFPSQDTLPDDFAGCRITLDESLEKIERLKEERGLDFEVRIIREVTTNEDCLGMILGTNVLQGEELNNINLLDLVVGISDPNEEQKEIEKTEYDLYTLKLREINKLDRNLIELPVFNQASYVVELEGYKTISHIGKIEALTSYEYIFSEQCGKIHGVIDKTLEKSNPNPADGLNAPTILDLSERVNCESEKGVYTFGQIEIENTKYLLVSYLRDDLKYILSSFEIIDESTISNDESIIVEFETDNAARVHFGGKIIIEDDLSFTLCLGDLNSPGNSAKFDTPWGKVLNISNSNLMDSKILDINDSRVKVLAFGLRNPWSCYIAGDDLIIPDVGNIQWEEINIIPKYREIKEAVFFGWPWREGYFAANYQNTPVDKETESLLLSRAETPKYTYPHANGYCAIIGGVNLIHNTAWENFGLIGDFCTGTIWAIEHKSDRAYRVLDPGVIPYKITTIQETLKGEALIGTTNGDIIRLNLP